MQPEANESVRPSLLIADDDAVVRAALSAQLASQFDVVAAVASASEAIAEAEKHRPDAALIDVEVEVPAPVQARPMRRPARIAAQPAGVAA